MTVTAPDLGRLSRQLRGAVALPADPGYDLARQLHLAEFDRFQPQAIDYSEKEEPDLFWALRGGGAGFGVVVEFESEAIHAPQGIHFPTMWAWPDAHQVLQAWQEWIVSAPREIGSSVL